MILYVSIRFPILGLESRFSTFLVNSEWLGDRSQQLIDRVRLQGHAFQIITSNILIEPIDNARVSDLVVMLVEMI